MLWEFDGTPHRLLGSAHVLPAETVLPNWVAASHDGIGRFIFEAGGEGSTQEIGIDRTRAHLRLSEVSAAYQSAKKLLASIGSYEPFDDLLPWRVAFHVVNRFLPLFGVSPIYGVDYQLKMTAESSRLKIDFLESSTHSQELIDLSCKNAVGGLSFLEQTICHIKSGESRIELMRIMRAWIASDLADFAAILNENLIECPYIFSAIITQRNREWVKVAKRLAAEKIPTLFVVGGLHTVGTGSFVEQLESNGLSLKFIA